jgi:hypothetical protein
MTGHLIAGVLRLHAMQASVNELCLQARACLAFVCFGCSAQREPGVRQLLHACFTLASRLLHACFTLASCLSLSAVKTTPPPSLLLAQCKFRYCSRVEFFMSPNKTHVSLYRVYLALKRCHIAM